MVILVVAIHLVPISDRPCVPCTVVTNGRVPYMCCIAFAHHVIYLVEVELFVDLITWRLDQKQRRVAAVRFINWEDYPCSGNSSFNTWGLTWIPPHSCLYVQKRIAATQSLHYIYFISDFEVTSN